MIEYRVRKVSRYVVTEYVEDIDRQLFAVRQLGEFDNTSLANEAAAAFYKANESHDKELMLISNEQASYQPQKSPEIVVAEMLMNREWSTAPHKTTWGDGMLVADYGINKDETAVIFLHSDTITYLHNLVNPQTD